MRRHAYMAFALLLIAGCDKSEKSTGPDGSSVELAKDEAAMAQVKTLLDSLVGKRPADIAEAALAHIKTMPEFKASGLSEDGSVWAQFQDGVLLSIGTNDADLDVQPTPPVPKPAASLFKQGAAGASAAGGEIPGSATAYVFNAFEANRGVPADQIAQQLAAAGYNVIRGTGSLEEWRGVSNAGVVFAACHGTRIPDGGTTYYYLQSSNVHVKGDGTYLADLAAHRMAFDMVAVDDEPLERGKLPKNHWESRYLFKAEYLTNAKMFAANGFLFNAACSGTSGPGLAFAQALRSKNNLSVYAGWSQPVYIPDDIESMLFFFDRALGINQFPPVDAAKPPPAEWSKVLSAMGSNPRASGNGTNLNTSDPQLYDTEGRNPISVFSIQNLSGGDLSTLVPSATGSTTDAANESLVITGSFGSVQGRVSVEGADVAVKKWTPTQITTALPKASGKALITSKSGLLSNKIDVTVASKVAMTPKGGGYLPDDRFNVSVTPRSAAGVTYSYHWKVTGASNLTMQDGSGSHTGLDFTSADYSVSIRTTPSTQGTIKVSCVVTTSKDSLVGSAEADFVLYPNSNKILIQSGGYPSNPNVKTYFAYVLLKKDATRTVAPEIRWNTYVRGELKSESSVKGTAMTKVYDIGTLGDPNVGPPYILITVASTTFTNPTDYSFGPNDVPYPYDLGDHIALVVAYRSWNTTDTSSTIVGKSTAFVDTTAAKTQVTAGLVYP